MLVILFDALSSDTSFAGYIKRNAEKLNNVFHDVKVEES
jgi:hypothetical protein